MTSDFGLYGDMIEIVEKNPDFVVVYKSAGVPSQSDASGDTDAMAYTARQLSALGEGDKIFLVHRLDRVVGGLMVFARNKDSAAALCENFASGDAIKEYFAVIEGTPPAKEGVFVDFLIKDSILNKAIVRKDKGSGAKRAELTYSLIDTKRFDGKSLSLVRVTLKTGRFHQIRAQFASRRHPLLGDGKYGSKYNRTTAVLMCHALTIDGERIECPVPKTFPWSLFSDTEL